MVNIPDYSHINLPTNEEIAAHNAAIDAEIAAFKVAYPLGNWRNYQRPALTISQEEAESLNSSYSGVEA